MSLFLHIHPNEQTQVVVWHIEENEATLLQGIVLTDTSRLRVENMLSETHRKGFLSIRHLLIYLGYSDQDLFYTPDGKPHLRDGKQISITHSFDFSALIVSNNPVGIDIEKNREKIKSIAPKFIGAEWDFLDHSHKVEQLTVIWGAKESLYKIHPIGGLLFKEHLPIAPFYITDKQTHGWIKKDPYNEVFSIYFDFFEGYTLVYALPKR